MFIKKKKSNRNLFFLEKERQRKIKQSNFRHLDTISPFHSSRGLSRETGLSSASSIWLIAVPNDKRGKTNSKGCQAIPALITTTDGPRPRNNLWPKIYFALERLAR